MRFGIGLLRLAVARAPAFLSFVSCPPCGLCPCLLVSLPCFSPRLFFLPLSPLCRCLQRPRALHAAALGLLVVAACCYCCWCCCCCRCCLLLAWLLLLVAAAAAAGCCCFWWLLLLLSSCRCCSCCL